MVIIEFNSSFEYGIDSIITTICHQKRFAKLRILPKKHDLKNQYISALLLIYTQYLLLRFES